MAKDDRCGVSKIAKCHGNIPSEIVAVKLLTANVRVLVAIRGNHSERGKDRIGR